MTEHNWSKSKLNYIHSSIYKNIPSTLYMYYSRIKQKKKFKKAKIPTGALIPLFFSCSPIVMTFLPIVVGVINQISLCSGFLSSSDIRAAFLNRL